MAELDFQPSELVGKLRANEDCPICQQAAYVLGKLEEEYFYDLMAWKAGWKFRDWEACKKVAPWNRPWEELSGEKADG